MATSKKVTIGTNAFVKIPGVSSKFLAKIDTGADGTAIWASDIFLDEQNRLRFTFFDKGSPLYTGEEQVYDTYEVIKVSSSTGHAEIRFRVKLPIVLGGKNIAVWCSLTDRSGRKYPMLIGKRTLYGKFIVDVTKSDVKFPPVDTKKYQKEFKDNPKEFIKKYKNQIVSNEE